MIKLSKRCLNGAACVKQLHDRREAGNTIILSIAVIAMVIMPLLLFFANLSLLTAKSKNDLSALEAAALVAAYDISKVVMDDDHFGAVSLSDYPAISASMLAKDGQPVSVVGINSLVGAARTENIIGHALGNDSLIDLSEADANAISETGQALTKHLQKCLSNESASGYGVEGIPIKPLADVRKILEKNLNCQPGDIRNLRLTLGWLDSGSVTTIIAPQPDKFGQPPGVGQVTEAQINGATYRSFVNIPANGRDYYFAGVGREAAIVTADSFRLPDGKRPCSVVKVEADIRVRTLGSTDRDDQKSGLYVHEVACARAFTNGDPTSKGVLTLNFLPSGRPAELKCLADLLTLPNSEYPTTVLSSIYGDYGADPEAKYVTGNIPVGGQHPGSKQAIADAIHSWIINVGGAVKLDTLVSVLHTQFAGGNNPGKPVYVYRVDHHGNAIMTGLENNPFNSKLTSESQTLATVHTSLSGLVWTVSIRNHSSRLARDTGKHAGQPLCPVAANWGGLSYFTGDKPGATRVTNDEDGLMINCSGVQAMDPYNNESIPGSVSSVGAIFTSTKTGKPILMRPASYCGGEVADITFTTRFNRGFRGPHGIHF